MKNCRRIVDGRTDGRRTPRHLISSPRPRPGELKRGRWEGNKNQKLEPHLLKKSRAKRSASPAHNSCKHKMFTQDKVDRGVKDELVGHANSSYTIVIIPFIGTQIVSMSATSVNVDRPNIKIQSKTEQISTDHYE